MSKLVKNSYNLPSLMTITLTLPLLFSTTHTNASTLSCQQVDKEIAKHLKTSFKYSGYNRSGNESYNYDLVKKSNATITNTLKKYMQHNDSFNCDFPLSSEQDLLIKASDDQKLRIFSWDKNTGGSRHNFAGLSQFKDKKGNVHLSLKNLNKDGQSFPNSLFTATLNGKATYMVVSTGIYSTKDLYQSLQAFTINGDKMHSSKVIKTKSGLTNKIGFAYDLFSLIDKQKPSVHLFEYDKQKKTIRFPVVVADDEYPSGKVTDKNIEYTFDGQYFQRVKN